MSKRRQKRINETAQDFEDKSHSLSTQAQLAAKADEELFSLDRVGSKSARRRVVKEIAVQEAGKISRSEQKLVEKAQLVKRKLQYEKHKINGGEEVIRDLWDVEIAPKSKKSNNTVNKTRVALPGQSYNPTVDDHQNALAEALALEIKRREAIESQRTDNLIGNYNTDATDSFIMDAESDNDGSDSEQGTSSGLSRKKKTKLTRAQRNKIKTRNAATFEDHKEKFEKNLVKSIDTLPLILRSIAAEEQLMLTRQQLKETQKKQAEEEKLLNILSYEDAAAVPLSDELTGSLRTLIPKGVAVVDRTRTMRKNGDLMLRDRRKRKAYEKPHGDKHVVWVPKYKTAALMK